MKTIFVDAIFGNLEGDMPHLEISVSYDKNAKQYRLYCCPCRHSGSCTESMFGVTQCGATLETVARGNAKILEKWEQWAEDHKQGILKAFSLAGQELHATRDAIKAYVEEWGGKEYKDNGQGNKDNGQQTTDNGPQAKDNGQRTTDNGKKEAQITVDTKAFQKAVKEVTSILNKKIYLPVLENILVEIKQGKMFLTTDNSEVRYTIEVAGDNVGEASFLVNAIIAKKLKHTGKTLTITAKENDQKDMDVKMGSVQFVSESESLKFFPQAHDFGSVDDSECLTFQMTDEHKAVAKSCVTSDDIRIAMHGIYFDTDCKYMVASDGHTLNAIPTDFGKCVGGFIIRKEVFNLMSGAVSIIYNKDNFSTYNGKNNGNGNKPDSSFYAAVWENGTHKVIARTIDDRYPNWKSVVPSSMPYMWKFADITEVNAAFTAICNAMECKKRARPVAMRFFDGSDICKLSAQDIDFNIKSEHDVHLDKPSVGNYEIAINADMARTMLNSSWDGTFYTRSASHAMVFGKKTAGAVLLVMPMTLNDAYDFPYVSQPVEGDYTTFEYHDYSKDSKEAKEEQKKPTLSKTVEQFYSLKEKHPEAMLLFRVGDFYETYDDDAPKAAETLGITLTKSNKLIGKDGKPLAMAGFPHHALDIYLPKLIRAGYRVAICDQLKDVVEEVKPNPNPNEKPADPIHEPTDADDVEQKANDYEPRPEGWIPPMPQYVMWVDEDKQQPDMVAGIYKYNEVVKHVSENDATIYHKITSGDGFVLALETSLYLPAVDKMVTFSFYTGKDLGEVCKLTNGDKVAVYTWEEGVQALDILHQVNKDVAL